MRPFSHHHRRNQSSASTMMSIRRRLAEQIAFVPRAADGEGQLSDLLARDKRAAGLLDSDFEEMPAEFVSDGEEEEGEEDKKKKKKKSSAASTSSNSSSSSSYSPPPEVPTALDGTTPLTCAQAIDAGEIALRSGDASFALRLFEAALDLPGSAAVRLSGSPREFSCASDAEAAAALYNMSCAYVALGDFKPALTCLEGAVEGGGKEIAEAARGDPDLEALRTTTSSKFESALKKGIEAHSNPAAASGGGGGPAGVLGGLAARLFRRGGGGGDGGGRDSATVAGRSVGVLERILRPW